MGKMALEGFWPPENRVVFSPNEMSSAEDVESACQIGFISKQQSRPSIIKRSSRNQTTLTFFHKTCGEKCAGEYLAHIAEDNSPELTSKLSKLKTAQDALSVRLILQFACGYSEKAAALILQRLYNISNIDNSVGRQKMIMHVEEKLDLEETLMIQNLMDICLRCNYEADCKAEFNHLLSGLLSVTSGLVEMIHFLGISAFSSVALSYYLSNQRGYWAITLRPAAHPCDNYVIDYGPLVNIMTKAQIEANHIPVDIIRKICQEYVSKHPDMHELNRSTLVYSPAHLLSNIRMWQACEGLPTAEESDIGPIIASTKKVQFAVLDLTSFNLPERNIDQLLNMIAEGYLSKLLCLKIGWVDMSVHQTKCLARDLKKMLDLRVLHMPNIVNLADQRSSTDRCMTMLIQSLRLLKSLEILFMHNIAASSDDMAQFVKTFPSFASHLTELEMTYPEVGIMNDRIASQLTKHLPIANKLRKLIFNIDSLRPSTQDKLLSALVHLSRLFELQITFKQFPNDILRRLARVMRSLPELLLLALSTAMAHEHSIDSATWQQFRATLLQMKKLNDLRLLHIAFTKDDLTDLVDVCRKKRYKTLIYSAVFLPKGFVPPHDDFLMLG